MEGLWKNQRAAWYNSRQFSANEIIEMLENYKYVKIGLRYNKFYEADTARPKFVFQFEPSNTKYANLAELPFSDASDFSNVVEFFSDLKEALEDIRQKAMRIQDGLGNIDSNYHAASAIESITDELLSKLDGDE
jgi:hypothetical protein